MGNTVQIAYGDPVELDISELQHFQGNLKTLTTENYNKLRKEIADTGFSFVIHSWQNPKDKKWYTCDGHQRLRTLTKMREEGWQVPKLKCIPVHAKDEKQAKRRVLQGTSQFGEITSEGLYEFLSESDLEFSDVQESFRFPEVDFDSFEQEYFTEPDTEGNTDDDAVPEDVEAISRPGDVWELGDHRIMCGDSTNKENVGILFRDRQPDLVFTSPPYNVGIDYNTHNDKMDIESYKKLLTGVISNIPDDATIIWNKGAWVHESDFRTDLGCLSKRNLSRIIIWKKTGITGPPVLQHTRNNPVVKNYLPFLSWEFLFVYNTEKLGKRKIPAGLIDKRQTDVWECSQHKGSDGSHPAAFPVEIAEDAIGLYCDEIVYEPFLGSGSTLIAAEKKKRRCLGMDVDEKYISITIKRWMDYTEKMAYRQEPDGTKRSWAELKDEKARKDKA